MAVSIAEYLGQRTDVDQQIVPVAKGTQIQCPFMDRTCDKASKVKNPTPPVLKWSTKTGHRVRVFSSIDFPIRLVVTHHYIRAVLVRCNIQRYSPLLRELHR